MNKKEMINKYAFEINKYTQNFKAWENVKIEDVEICELAEMPEMALKNCEVIPEIKGYDYTIKVKYMVGICEYEDEIYVNHDNYYENNYGDKVTVEDIKNEIEDRIKELKKYIETVREYIDIINDCYDKFDNMIKNFYNDNKEYDSYRIDIFIANYFKRII